MHSLSPSKSSFLDLIRWVAALVVVIGHADMYLGLFGGGNPIHQSTFGYFGMHAHAAVIVFFVLSGYVVAYATNQKNSLSNYGFRDYFLDRWSRIYSVLLVAIIFTLALDQVGGLLSPFYADPALKPQDNFGLRLIANLIGIQGVWGYRIQLGSNPALWSIGYEFIFYILFGVLYFRRNIFRRAWIGVLIVLVMLAFIGWKMAVYFCIWLAGVVAYHASRFPVIERNPVSGWLILSAFVAANHLIMYSNIFGVIEVLRDCAFAILIAFMLSLEVKSIVPFFLRHRERRISKYLAGFSYSIYAFHTPVIFFGCSLLFWPGLKMQESSLSGLVLVSVSILVARGAFYLAESRRATFRRFADKLMRQMGI